MRDLSKILNELPLNELPNADYSFFFVIINWIIDFPAFRKAQKEDPELIKWAVTQ